MSDRRYNAGGGGDYGGYRGRGYQGGVRRDYGDRQYDGRRGHRGGGGGDYHRGGGRDFHGRGRGGRGGSGPRYQSSYVGQKRVRDEPETMDPKKQFIKRLMKLGEPGPLAEDDKTNAGDTPEHTFETTFWALKQEIKHNTENLHQVLIEAVVSCSHKTTHYALLLGMLHAEQPDWVAGFINTAGQQFASQLAEGQVDAPRLLMRFFAGLTNTNVLHPADVLGLMERVLEVAKAQADAGVDPSGATWQPWADQLVYGVLAGLVWGGAELAEAAAVEHARVMEAAAAYMAVRPIQESVELRPMFGAADAADASAASDSGGASFLGQLWAAVEALSAAEEHPWHVSGIPRELIDSLRTKLTGAPVELPEIQLPQAAPGVAGDMAQLGLVGQAEAAMELQDRYPPRGGMVILDAQYTDGGRSAAERFVAEEYIIDLLKAFDGHRVVLVQMLCNSLPLPYDYSGLLCETLFAQLLRLPTPRLSPLAFSSLIAHAALLRPAFPKYLAGSVRQLFLRVQFLAPELVLRLAEVLAHFITNMSFRWPWDKYRLGLSQSPGGPQRTFLVLVLQHLVRLTAWDHELLLQETPQEFLALLGEPPAFQGLPRPVPYPPPPAAPEAPNQQQQQPQQPERPAAAADGDGDAAMQEAPAGQPDGQAGQGEGGDEEEVQQPDRQQEQEQGDEQPQQPEADGQQRQQQQQDAQAMDTDAPEGQQQQPLEEEQQDPVQEWAGKILGVLQARPNPDGKPWGVEQVLQWMDEQQVIAALGSPEAQLRAVATAVLAAGAKSCSHCYVLTERYSHLLLQLMQGLGQAQGQDILLDVLGHMYGRMPTRLNIALSRLCELQLLSPATAISWLAAAPRLTLGPGTNEGAAADSWATLNSALLEIFARHQGALEAKARLAADVEKAEAKLAAASQESAAAAEEHTRAQEAAAAGEGGDAAAARQRVPYPGGAAPGGGRRPVSRLEMAQLREDAMAKRVAAAQAAVQQQQQELDRLEADRADALLTAFKALSNRVVDALSAAAEQAAALEQQHQQQAQQDMADAAGDEATEQHEQQQREEQKRAEAVAAKSQAAKQLVLAQLRGFARAFRSQVVQLGLTQQLLQHIESLELEPDVRAALLGPFGLA